MKTASINIKQSVNITPSDEGYVKLQATPSGKIYIIDRDGKMTTISSPWDLPVKSASYSNPANIIPGLYDRYIIKSPGQGLWSGKENKIAQWNGSTWEYYDAVIGLTVYNEEHKNLYTFHGDKWGVVSGSSENPVTVTIFAPANIDLSNPPTTIDNYALQNGDTIALFNQSDFTQDGIYVFQSGALIRSEKYPLGYDLYGHLVVVLRGDTNAGNIYQIINDKNAVIGTDDIIAKLIVNNMSTIDDSMSIISIRAAETINNINIATAKTGILIDGSVEVGEGDVVGLFAQTNPRDNGFYRVSAYGWTRASDILPTGENVAGKIFAVREGCINGNSIMMFSTETGSAIVGIDSLQVVNIARPNSAETWETRDLTATDVNNKYIDLQHVALTDKHLIVVQNGMVLTENADYTTEIVDYKTRINFLRPIYENDKITTFYAYIPQRVCPITPPPTTINGIKFKLNVTSENYEFRIASIEADAGFTIDWGNGNIVGYTGSQTNIGAIYNPGTYYITITNDIKHLIIATSPASHDLTLVHWGDLSNFISFENTFQYLKDFKINADDNFTPVNQVSCAFMFYNCTNFDSDISGWDTSNVVDMTSMFEGCTAFNAPIGFWTISNVTKLDRTFKNASTFNQPLGSWDTSNVTSMNETFRGASSFNRDITTWDVSNVVTCADFRTDSALTCDHVPPLPNSCIDCGDKFKYTIDTSSNQNHPLINLSKASDEIIVNWGDGTIETYTDATVSINHTYATAGTYTVEIHGINSFSFGEAVSQPITIVHWGDLNNVTTLENTFNNISSLTINPDDTLDPANIVSAASMFESTTIENGSNFNSINFGKFNNIESFFKNATLNNIDLSTIDLSNITSLNYVFYGVTATDILGLNSWNVSTVTTFISTFESSNINEPLNNWNMSNATDLTRMFANSSFDQDISGWNVSNVTACADFKTGAPLTCEHAPNLIDTCIHCADTFKFVYEANSTSLPLQLSFTRASGTTIIYWGDGSYDTVSSNGTELTRSHTYSATGSYTVEVVGFDNFRFYSVPSDGKIIVTHWGDFNNALSFDNSFENVPNLKIDADDTLSPVNPVTAVAMFKDAAFDSTNDFTSIDFTKITDFTSFFEHATLNNIDISPIDVSNAVSLANFFYNTYGLTADLSTWNVSNVNDISGFMQNSGVTLTGLSNWNTAALQKMDYAFASTSFNENIGNWNTSAVTSMKGVFYNNAYFNQDISGWDTSSVTDMSEMFYYASAFDQDISGWNVSNVIACANFRENSALLCAHTPHLPESCTGCSIPFVYNIDATSNQTHPNITLTNNSPIEINWGDGTIETYSDSEVTINHTYASAGTYTVKITGFSRFRFAEYVPQPIEITKWGSLNNVATLDDAFSNVQQLKINASDTLDLVNQVTAKRMFKYTNLDSTSDLSTINTINITDMEEIFASATLNGLDLSSWNTQNVTSLKNAFNNTRLIGDLSTWNTSNVTNMSGCFAGATFNIDPGIGNWNVSSVTNFSYMFANTTFNSPLATWNTGRAQTFESMFENATFNHDISGWDVSRASNFAKMFKNNPQFNQDISGWDMSNATTTAEMFRDATGFNQPIGNWNLINTLDLSYMFAGATSFNNPIAFRIDGATTIAHMFDGASSFNSTLTLNYAYNLEDMSYFLANTVFNNTISIDTGNVTNMEGVFQNNNRFNQDISSWNVGNVTNMSHMFENASSFNRDISNWITSSATDMSYMFKNASSFNQPLNNWDVSQVQNFRGMFSNAVSFNQLLDQWTPYAAVDMSHMFEYCINFNQPFGSNWTNTSRLTNVSHMFDHCQSFNTMLRLDTSNVTDFSYMFNGCSSLNYDIDLNTVSGEDFSYMFAGCTVFNSSVVKNWDTRNAKNMSHMFDSASAFNQNIGGWNVSQVEDFSYMFRYASAFNQPIGSWDTSNAMNMKGMFQNATNFNQSIGGWNTTNVSDMSYMFQNTNYFNQNINGWNVGNVTDFSYMFDNASAFDQPLGNWQINNTQSLRAMFSNCPFNQDIDSWEPANCSDYSYMFYNNQYFFQVISDWDMYIQDYMNRGGNITCTGFADNSKLLDDCTLIPDTIRSSCVFNCNN